MIPGPFRAALRGLRALRHPDEADRDADDEIRHYHDQAVAAHLARGLSPEAAHRAARLELGSLTATREEVRSFGWEHALEALVADLRYAARRLRSRPGFTVATALTLGLGIGAATAIFGAVHPILLQPLPYPDPERVVMLWDVGADGAPLEATYGTYREVAERGRSFQYLAVMKGWQPVLQGRAEPERLTGQQVTTEYFRVLGVPPLLGEALRPEDDLAGAAPVMVLSHELWRRRFAGDPAIIGRQITLDGIPRTVRGVMPPAFENIPAAGAELWAPLQYDMSQDRAWGHHLRLIGRLRAGVSPAAAAQEIETIAGRPLPEFARAPWAALKNGLTVTQLQEDVTRGVRPALLAVLGAVLLVLLIACVNVTNLLLGHGVRRRGELALRAALGAGHGRLARQLVTENLLLAAIGGALGLAIAAAGVRAVAALGPPGIPRLGAVGVSGATFAFALLVTTLVGLGFGLVPALRALRGAQGGLEQGRRFTGGGGPLRAALVIAEVALALVLLVGSGLLLRSMHRLLAVDAGFDPSGRLTLQIQTAGPRMEEDAARHRYFAAVVDAVRQVPGVTAAGLTSQLPLSGDLELYGVHFDPKPPQDPGEIRGTFRYAVTPGYLEAMGISLKAGRLFQSSDRAGAPRVALVSEGFARRRLPGLDPLGRRIRIGAPEWPPFTIVGVVGNVRQVSLALEDIEGVYIPADQWHFADAAMSLAVRTTGDPAALVPALRRAIWSVDRDQAIVRVATAEDLVAASAAERRFALVLFEAFAVAALLLAAAGIYGVLATSVAERTREIGVRAALGASRRSILGLVVGQGMGLVTLGALLGVLLSAAATDAIAAMLFGVSRLDAVTYATVVVLLGLVALAACALPAWRAARLDPMVTLRAE
ncbi:MAG TPA: ABC transporter permease [Gemmatimonadales bacterium]|nr:ABC transporter permease [Gemmatimonadales bacterium]